MILDSRGNPTVEVDCYVDGALRGRAAVPSGASTGSHEAVDCVMEMNRWMGKGVEGAVTNVVERIQDALVGLPVDNQRVLDEIMIELDDTGNKAALGANATLGTSPVLSSCRLQMCINCPGGVTSVASLEVVFRFQ